MNAIDRNWKVGDIVSYLDAPPPAALEPELSWYVIQIAPKAETRVCERLEALGVQAYSPMGEREVVIIRRGRRFGRKTIRRPVFPGYVFVGTRRIGLFGIIGDIQGVSDFIRQDGFPAKVASDVIEAVMMAEDIGGLNEPANIIKIKVGDNVLISDGSFAGFSGTVTRVPKKEILAEESAKALIGVEISVFGTRATALISADRIAPLDK